MQLTTEQIERAREKTFEILRHKAYEINGQTLDGKRANTFDDVKKVIESMNRLVKEIEAIDRMLDKQEQMDLPTTHPHWRAP